MGVAFFKRMFITTTPLQLLIAHAKILEEVSNVTIQLVKDYFEGKDISETVKYISDKESEADDIKFQIRKVLAKSYKMPYAVSDLLNYLHNQETLVDIFEDIAKKLSLNRIDNLDKNVIENFMGLVYQAQKAIKFLEDMIEELKIIIDTSFAKKYITQEKKEILEVENIEGKADDISLELAKWIYSQKNIMNPIDLMFFRELILKFVRITDIAENTAEILYAFIK